MLAQTAHARTETARRYICLYKIYTEFEGKEPTTVCLYQCQTNYGGPEEGGWHYESGYPIRTICVFSKKQAINAAIDLEAYAKSEFGKETDYLGWPTYRICFDTKYGKEYPRSKPHYE